MFAVLEAHAFENPRRPASDKARARLSEAAQCRPSSLAQRRVLLPELPVHLRHLVRHQAQAQHRQRRRLSGEALARLLPLQRRLHSEALVAPRQRRLPPSVVSVVKQRLALQQRRLLLSVASVSQRLAPLQQRPPRLLGEALAANQQPAHKQRHPPRPLEVSAANLPQRRPQPLRQRRQEQLRPPRLGLFRRLRLRLRLRPMRVQLQHSFLRQLRRQALPLLLLQRSPPFPQLPPLLLPRLRLRLLQALPLSPRRQQEAEAASLP